MSSSPVFTLITGASMGIGRSLALACAAQKRNVLLVALEAELLEPLCQKVRETFGVEAHYFVADLTISRDTRAVYEWCTQNGFVVNMLLSNAGMGMSGLYERNDLSKYRSMVLLNNMAAVELTYHFLPMLKAQSPSYLMYTSSMEATIAIPYKAVYSGSKHFLYGFALALKEELREFGVQVSVLCPGPVATNAGTRARIQTQGVMARLLTLDADEVARIALNGLITGRQVIVPGFWPALLERVANTIPRRPRMKIFHHIFRQYKNIQG